MTRLKVERKAQVGQPEEIDHAALVNALASIEVTYMGKVDEDRKPLPKGNSESRKLGNVSECGSYAIPGSGFVVGGGAPRTSQLRVTVAATTVLVFQ